MKSKDIRKLIKQVDLVRNELLNILNLELENERTENKSIQKEKRI